MPMPMDDRQLQRAETLAHWLDDRWLDPLLGFLLPGVGDVIGSLLGLYIVGIAVVRRLPAVTLARMLLNLALDALVGAIPVAGDVFDFAWKANRRNVTLLRARTTAPAATGGDWLLVGGAVLLVLVALATPIVALWAIVHWAFTH
ncbi:MAG TPA: DUF4112 domain-containing protein [Polyangia bacterium]|jgi:hypothetical protein|nr:DUF4112 domain-containing protein [Polyangia bacterium]